MVSSDVAVWCDRLLSLIREMETDGSPRAVEMYERRLGLLRDNPGVMKKVARLVVAKWREQQRDNGPVTVLDEDDW